MGGWDQTNNFIITDRDSITIKHEMGKCTTCFTIPKFKNIDDLPQCDDTEKVDFKSQYHRYWRYTLSKSKGCKH